MSAADFKILTYNVTKDFSKQDRFIRRLIEDINDIEPVIAGLQEVSQETFDFMSTYWQYFTKYKAIMCQNHRLGDSYIMTLVHPIVRIKAVCWGDFTEAEPYTPFQILICEVVGKDLLIVNCQFPNINKEYLEEIIVKKLSENLTYGYKFSDATVDSDDTYQIIVDEYDVMKVNIKDLIIGKRFKIIMMGDFQDKDELKLYEGFRPFKTKYNSDFNKLSKQTKNLINNIKTQEIKKPPKTCCYEYDRVNDEFSRKKTDKQMKDIGDYILVDKNFKIKEHNTVPLTAERRTPGNRRVPHEITSLHYPSVLNLEFQLDDKSPSSEAPESAFKSFSFSKESSNSRFESVSGDNQPTALKFKCEKEIFKSPKVKKEKPKKGDKKKTDKKKGDKKGDKKGKEKKSKKKKKSS